MEVKPDSIKSKLEITVLILLWVGAFAPVYPELFRTWIHNPNNSHGILVPVISAFLVWRKRDELKSKTLSNAKLGGYILTGSMIIYILAYAGAVAVVCRAMLVLSLIGLVLFLYGKEIFSELRFPLFFLCFMIPIPESLYGLIAFPLQLFATKMSTCLVQSLGIPAYREGNMVYFAKTQLEVAEACSGIRSIMAFIMLGFLFGYLMGHVRYWRKALIALSGIPLAILANIMRVTGMGILADFYGGKVARGFLHQFSGLAVFALGFILLFFEYLILQRSKRTPNAGYDGSA